MGRLTHTVSGSIATVRSPTVAPIESLKVHFSPIQEGTGDPSPSNVRPITGWTGVTGYKSGKNLIDYNALTIFDIGDDYGERRGFTFTKPGTYYIKSLKTWENNSYIYCRVKNADGTYGNIQYFVAVKTVTNRTITIQSGQTLLIFNSVKTTEPSGTVEATIERFDGWGVVVSFNDVDSYEPHSGETIPVTFPAGGKNLIDFTVNQDTRGVTVSKENGKLVLNGTATGGDAYCVTFISMHLEPGTYTASSSGFTTGVEFVLTKNGLWFRNATAGTTFTLTEASTVSGYVRVMSGNSVDATVSFMLETGSTASAFEPYTDTAYGGYVDLATGEIYAEYGSYVLTGSASDGFVYRGTVTHGNNVHYQFGTKLFDRIVENTSSTKTYCDIAKATISQTGWALDFMFYAGTPQYQVNFFIKDSVCDSTEESFNAWLSEHNVHFVYKLATPKLIATLTPQELATFKGYSNFWSNAGDVDVTYQVVESSEMTKERQKIFAGNAPTIHTASGSVANFEMEPGLNRNLKSCKVGFLPVQEGSGDPFPPINQNGSIVGVDNIHNESELSSFKIHFSPIQSGTGDPSPTNIRPITGWTGVTGYKGGKNLYSSGDQTFERYKVVSIGRVITPGTYTLSLEVTSTDTDDIRCDVYLFNGETSIGKSKGFSRNVRNSWTFTTDLSFDTLYLYAAQTWLASEGDTATFSNIQLEVGSTATTYEPYSAPTSYPVSWESQGTVYGGYVDLVSGELYSTVHRVQNLGNLYWESRYTGNNKITVSATLPKNYDYYDDAPFIASERYKINGVVGGVGALSDPDSCDDGIYWYHSTFNYTPTVIYLVKGINDTVEGSFIYRPINKQLITTLTPVQIALATGKSSYWSNADAVTVKTAGNVRNIYKTDRIEAFKKGKNLFTPFYKGKGVSSNTGEETQSATHAVTDYIPITFSNDIQSYYLSGLAYRIMSYICAYNKDKAFVGRTVGTDRSYAALTKDTFYLGLESAKHTGDIAYIRIDQYKGNSEYEIDEIDSVTPMLNIGTSALPYEAPYSETLDVPLVLGKNLFDERYPDITTAGDIYQLHYRYYYVGDGNILASSNMPSNGNSNSNLFILPGITTTGAGTNVNDINRYHSRIITPVNGYITFAYRLTAGVDPRDYWVMVERVSEGQTTPSEYEPMNALFGGYVDLVTGEVWKTYNMIDLGNYTWNVYGSGSTKFFYITGFSKNKEAGRIICASYPSNGITTANTNEGISANGNVIRFRWSEYSNYTVSELKAVLTGVNAVYELETPQLVTTLTPTQIQALKGTNNILSDANGIIEVKYWSH